MNRTIGFKASWQRALAVVLVGLIGAMSGCSSHRTIPVEFENETSVSISEVRIFPPSSRSISIVSDNQGRFAVRLREALFEQEMKVQVRLSDGTEVDGYTGSVSGIGDGRGRLTRVVIHVKEGGVSTHFDAIGAVENVESSP